MAILLYRPQLLTVGGLKLVREIRGEKKVTGSHEKSWKFDMGQGKMNKLELRVNILISMPDFYNILHTTTWCNINKKSGKIANFWTGSQQPSYGTTDQSAREFALSCN